MTSPTLMPGNTNPTVVLVDYGRNTTRDLYASRIPSPSVMFGCHAIMKKIVGTWTQKRLRELQTTQSNFLRAAVRTVFYARSQPDPSGNAYELACFYDLRPLFIIPAAVNHTNKILEQAFQGSIENARRKGRWNISGSTLRGESGELRDQFPTFDQVMKLASNYSSVMMGFPLCLTGARLYGPGVDDGETAWDAREAVGTCHWAQI